MACRFMFTRAAPTAGFAAVIYLSLYVLTFAASLLAQTAAASPGGELDPAFGDHGRVLLRDDRFAELGGIALFADPASGKLLAVVSGWYGNALLRFNGDGSLDSTFGDRGSVTLDFGEDRVNIADAKLLPDGRLLLAGAMNVYGDPANVIHGSTFLARVHPDGTPDDSFGSNGRAAVSLGGVYEALSKILPQPDGHVVVFGSTDLSRDTQSVLARFTPEGSLDPGFGSQDTPGIGIIDAGESDASLPAVTQYNDGSFLACGSAPERILAVRVRGDGTQDAAFGNNSVATVDLSDEVSVHDCNALPDGQLIIVGSRGLGNQQRAAAFRLMSDGGLDTSFGASGTVALPTTVPAMARAVQVMIDGSLAIAASSVPPNILGSHVGSDMLVARIDAATDQIDPAFGDRGVTVIDFGARGYGANATPVSIIQQADGKLVVIGTQVDQFDWYGFVNIAIARIAPYGSGTNGWAGLAGWAGPTGAPSVLSASVLPGSTALVSVRRTGGFTGQLAVNYRTVDGTARAGTDYVASNGTITWPEGDSSERTIAVAVMAVAQTETKQFEIELFGSTGGLASDLGTIWITPPAAASGGSADFGGGGAIGTELWLLLTLAVLRYLWPRRMSSLEGVEHDRGTIADIEGVEHNNPGMPPRGRLLRCSPRTR